MRRIERLAVRLGIEINSDITNDDLNRKIDNLLEKKIPQKGQNDAGRSLTQKQVTGYKKIVVNLIKVEHPDMTLEKRTEIFSLCYILAHPSSRIVDLKELKSKVNELIKEYMVFSFFTLASVLIRLRDRPRENVRDDMQ